MRTSLSLLVTGLLVACGGSHGGDGQPDAPGGGDDDGGPDLRPDASCGGVELDLTYVAPNFMIALDRSCSMKAKLTGTTTSKWEAAVAALQHVLGTHAAEIRWGLSMFPDITGDSCTQDPAAFAIADNNASAISTLLGNALASTDPYFPDGPCVTNIDTGIETAATDPALADPTHPGYVMLISDGAQAGCSTGGGNAGTTAAIADLFTNRGIKTFVVGFGSQVDATHLNQFADAGGAALPGATKYYQADTASQLDAAFQSIAELAVSCDYVVDPPPADLNQTYVYFSSSELIPRDTTHAGGWDYDSATKVLTLYGNECARLKSHAVTDVRVLFGCPTPPIF